MPTAARHPGRHVQRLHCTPPRCAGPRPHPLDESIRRWAIRRHRAPRGRARTTRLLPPTATYTPRTHSARLAIRQPYPRPRLATTVARDRLDPLAPSGVAARLSQQLPRGVLGSAEDLSTTRLHQHYRMPSAWRLQRRRRHRRPPHPLKGLFHQAVLRP
eukprot:9480866-Pyramimonas_sp.AAC.1